MPVPLNFNKRQVLYELLNNNQWGASLHTGAIVSSMRSVGGVSVQKQSFVIASVIQLLWGLPSKAQLEEMVPTHSTLDRAAQRFRIEQQRQLKTWFTVDDLAKSVVNACLMVDASNKCGTNVVGKLTTCLCNDDVIRANVLNPDETVTKKAADSASLTFDSLLEQVSGDGLYLITAVEVDYYGLAEGLKILALIDIFVVGHSSPRMQYVSKIILGQIYDLSVAYRARRALTCRMHAFDRLNRCYICTILLSPGLANTGTTAQNLYSCAHYLKQYTDHVQFLAAASLGDDPDAKLDPVLARELGFLVPTRWLTAERTCDQMWRLLNVKATDALITTIRGLCTAYDDDTWAGLIAMAGTPDDDKVPSHIMLVFLCLANCGTKESALRCFECFTFLSSCLHRVYIKLCESIYRLHLGWAKWLDGRSQINLQAETFGTRLQELFSFERTAYQQLDKLRNDGFITELPGVAATIERESTRLTQQTVPEFKDTCTKRGREAVDAVWKLVPKYLCNQLNTLPWSVLMLSDPYVGPFVARGILEALLREDNFAESSQNFVPLPMADLRAENEKPPFTVEDECLAWPGKTKNALAKDVAAQWKSPEAKAMAKAYGIGDPNVVKELLCLARGKLMTELKESGTWKPGDGTCTFWDTFKRLFPALADMSHFHFAGISIVTTSLEQLFTIMGGIGFDNNMTMDTISRNVAFRINFASQHFRAEEAKKIAAGLQALSVLEEDETQEADEDDDSDDEENYKPKPKTRHLRDVGSIHAYGAGLEALIAELKVDQAAHLDTVTAKSLRNKRKKAQEKMRPRVERALRSNGNNTRGSTSLKQAQEQQVRFEAAAITGAERLAPKVVNAFEKASTESRLWNVADKKRYLMEYYLPAKGGELAEVDIKKAPAVLAKIPDPPRSIACMLLDYWENFSEVSEDDLPAIMAEWKGKG